MTTKIILSVPEKLRKRYDKACRDLGYKDHVVPLYQSIAEVIQRAESMKPEKKLF